MNGDKPPWMSSRIWLVVIGVAGLLVYVALGHEVDSNSFVALLASFILGKSYENAQAKKGG